MDDMNDMNFNEKAGEMYIGLAKSYTDLKDYGTALYFAHVAMGFFQSGNLTDKMKEADDAIVKPIWRHMVLEFYELADKLDLPLTHDNFALYFREHSPSYVKYTSMMGDLKGLADTMQKNPGGLAEKVHGLVEKAEEAGRDKEDYHYLRDNLETLMTWEPSKGDPGLDLDRLSKGVFVAGKDDYLGEIDDITSEIRAQIGKIKAYLSSPGNLK